jgi:hypothetical protein
MVNLEEGRSDGISSSRNGADDASSSTSFTPAEEEEEEEDDDADDEVSSETACCPSVLAVAECDEEDGTRDDDEDEEEEEDWKFVYNANWAMESKSSKLIVMMAWLYRDDSILKCALCVGLPTNLITLLSYGRYWTLWM